ncbi:BNR-4 repeat-containing protein [Actinomadura sp. ATCC 31491]|uniref:BNR-4 repeat-containing protein n=1 Tax=Actinomadura luzonensis TaxID=2805427 RepID=A0ABT0FNJ2_9ACTN|nr:BNR-4 repeat-containing protein [Actinomadura luzonensis]MCK2213824.1 BNR-4 repeat-containing protein [Actinomadura luzonensis]
MFPRKLLPAALLAALTLLPAVPASATPAGPAIERLPVTVDSSNQAGWWRPVDTFGGVTYFAFDAPAPVEGRHEVHLASRGPDGAWRTGCLPDAAGGCVTYVDDVGHNQPSIVVDGDGRIHAFVSMHNNAWRYYRSARPGDVTSMAEAAAQLPDRDLSFTYPVTVRGADGDAYVLARADQDAQRVRGGRLYRFDTATGAWSRAAVLGAAPGHSFYPDDLQVDAAGRVHVLWEWAAWPASAFRHLGSYAVYDPADGSLKDVTGAPLTQPVSPGAGAPVVYQPFEGDETITSSDRAVQSAKLAVTGDRLVGIAYRYLREKSGNSNFSGFDVRYATWTGTEWRRETVVSRDDHPVDNSATIGVTHAGPSTRIYFVAEANGCLGSRSQVVKAERADAGGWAFSAVGDVRQGLQRLRAIRGADGTDLLYVTAPLAGALWRVTVPRTGVPGQGEPFAAVAARLTAASSGGGVNAALGATVTVSSVLRAGAEGGKAVDGLCTDDSRWISADGDTAPTITVDLGRQVTVGEVRVWSGYSRAPVPGTDVLRDFAVEARTADGWTRLGAVTGNTAGVVRVPGGAAVADQVRLLITDPSGNTLDVARVYEIEVITG